MAIWEDFEVECTDYLNQQFGSYATFYHQGGSDSTVADILVNTGSGNSFYMEAKHSPAQCGQFVLLPNLETRTFEYSKQNVTRMNTQAEMIMDYMNKSFDEFREAGTSGKEIDMPNASAIFADWIIQTYQDKGVKFFITNQYTILPIEEFRNYFEISAKYRIKRSGSSSVGKSRLSTVTDYINSHDYEVTNSRISGDKLFVTSSRYLHDTRFVINGTEYMFSLRGTEYELRRLSNTYNANVIFSIKLKSISGMSDEVFIQFLQ